MNPRSLSTDSLCEKIIGTAFLIHERLGSNAAPHVYIKTFIEELLVYGLAIELQKEYSILEKGKQIGSFIGAIVVEQSVVVDIRPANVQEESAHLHMFNRLKEFGLKAGVFIHFGANVQAKKVSFDSGINR